MYRQKAHSISAEIDVRGQKAWGRPASRVRLSFLPGVRAPGGAGQEDALVTYERDGLGVLIARSRTSLFEGRSAIGRAHV